MADNGANKKASTLIPAAALLAAISPQAALAQTSPGAGGGAIEEIVVTATKRQETSIQDVPFSVQAVSGDDLASAGVVDFIDFYRQVPGLSVFDAAPGNKRFVIRGVGGAGAGTVGVYLDEVVATGENLRTEGGLQADIKAFDIDRVEVLKGPQGTTFGSSSLIGTVRYITNKPELDRQSARLSFTGRSTEGADLGGRFEAMLNQPLVSNELGVRLAAYYEDQPGYIDAPLVPSGVEGADGVETFALRGSARYVPTDNLELNFMGMIQESDLVSDAFFQETDLLGNELGEFEQFNFARVPKFDDIKIFSATAEYRTGVGSIFASWSRFDRENNAATREATPVLFGITNPTTTPPGLATIIEQAKNRTLDTIELRFGSDWNGPIQLLSGVFWSDDDRPNTTTVRTTDSQGNPDPDGEVFLDSIEDGKVDELSFFADLSWNITDRLTASVGGRYYDFDLEVVNTSVVSLVGQPGTGRADPLLTSEHGLIGKFDLRYDLTDRAMIFFNVAEGFRSGGANNPGLCQVCEIPGRFETDSVVNYEIGAKTSWFDRRLQLNGAAYFIDWSDIQFQSFAEPPPGSALSGRFRFRDNGGAAEIVGLELDLVARPVEGLTVNLAVNASEAELSEDNPATTLGSEGDELEYSPDLTVASGVDYLWEIGWAQAFVGADWYYVSSQNTATSPLDPVYRKLDGYHLVNVRGGVTFENGWELSLLVDNLGNDKTLLTAYDATANAPLSLRSNRPRTVSVQVRKNFGGIY